MTKKKICFLMDGCVGHRDFFRQLSKSLEKEYTVTPLPKDGDVIILFTCGFTKRDPSPFLDSLSYVSEVKKKDAIFIITGCGVTMYDKDDLLTIDFVDYVFEYDNSISKICQVLNSHQVLGFTFDNFPGKLILEITMGCYKECGYCFFCKCNYLGIPVRTLLTVAEVCDLVRKYKTPILVLNGLNTTIYRDGENRLHDLLREISKIETLKWIELLCVASSGMYPELLEEIVSNSKIYAVNYFLQSGSDWMLDRMNIGSTVSFNEYVLSRYREKEEMSVSTAMIVGYPGERAKDIMLTKEFIIRNNLWYIDVLPYEISYETPSCYLRQLSTKRYWKHYDIIQGTVDKLAHNYLDNLVGKKEVGFIEFITIEDGKYGYHIRPLKFFGMINVFSERIECEIGDKVSVEISEIHDYHPATLIGKKMEVL